MIEYRRRKNPMASCIWCGIADWTGRRGKVSDFWVGTFAFEETNADWCVGQKREEGKNQVKYWKDFPAV